MNVSITYKNIHQITLTDAFANLQIMFIEEPYHVKPSVPHECIKGFLKK